jgi:hypothetical protein
MGRNLENKKELTPIQTRNSASMKYMTMVSNVDVFSHHVATIVFSMNNIKMNNVSCE